MLLTLLTETAGQKTVTIDKLKKHNKVTDSQLDTTISDSHIRSISEYFENVEDYVTLFGLKPGQQTDVKDLARSRSTQTAVSKMLKLWRERKERNAKPTYRALIKILLLVKKGDIADKLCKILCGLTID